MFSGCECCSEAAYIGIKDKYDNDNWPRGYKTVFMFISAEYEIFYANKYDNSKHFYIL